MYDSIKSLKEADLIISFIDEKADIYPQSLTILDQIISISKDISEYKIHLKDFSIYENKVYECFLKYDSDIIPYYLKINYGQKNHYYFGLKKNKMCFEFIFADFISKKIDNEKCFIKYNGKKYYAYDDENFLMLRCLNLINIDMNLLELPITYKDEIISNKIFDDTSFLIFVSVVEKIPKIFEIFLNKPFKENPNNITAEQVVKLLQPSLNKVQNILNYNDNKTYEEYLNEINMKELSSIYIQEIRNSVKLEEKIIPFFNFYRYNLTEEEILAFETYSEFMITFPSFKTMNRESQNITPYKFYKQHFYSHKLIYNFMKTIPYNINKIERTLLKYSACRCLRTLLLNEFAYFIEDLLYFYDLNTPETIYNEAKLFNEEFIEKLTEKSEIFLYLLQINSGSSINKLTNELTARISMLKIDQIKEHLRNSLPNYIIRIKNYCNFAGLTFNETQCTFISEVNLFGNFLDNQELKGGDTDPKYNKRLILSNLFQHERFGHVKFSMNFYSFKQDKENSDNEYDEPLSPRQFYQTKLEEKEKKENLIEVVEILDVYNKKIKKGESGIAFNVFLTQGNEKNANILRFVEADFSKIFKQPELFAAENLSLLNKLIEESTSNYLYPNFALKKISNEKYELKRENFLYIDNIPTIAKFSSK